ncbi:HNH endonuclease signature motif containing protein [Mycobacterium hubeiense]|uniref:HNH endonuclease signature motif containing protein n=1 Tax=Mycobacterium hubeiense TaxID=1867256 RepID=UPI000C7ECBDC|nr:HNH endonuclease signature motif containing protein [Mycobacterium sp. QGD 101]
MFELMEPPASVEPSALLDEMRAASRSETRAAAQRLTAVWQLYRVRLREWGDGDNAAVDTWDAVAAEVAAALNTSLGSAGNLVRFALAMHERLPLVGMVLAAGDIDYRLFQTIVYRTDLITDADTLAAVDTQLAARAPRWTSLSYGKLSREVDRIVAAADADAVRRRKERAEEREVVVADSGDGMAVVYANVFSTDGRALDQRLDALAATVCDKDPRTAAQRRADAIGAVAAGADRLSCRCGTDDCCAGGKLPASPVVLHLLADQATVDGASDKSGYLVGYDDLIPAELVAELAKSAKTRPLFDPVDAPPEPGYVPSAKLAEFVRCRDMTCRAPGCDQPATHCDIDHTVPHGKGGLTHPSNLKCLCRRHHLLKTFGGWRDKQLPDGTVIWTLPDGQMYVTTPGSALLFPNLCRPTGELAEPNPPAEDRCGNRNAMMPKRRRSRAQNRAHRVAAERRQNRQAREARRKACDAYHAELFAPHDDEHGDGEPPPF